MIKVSSSLETPALRRVSSASGKNSFKRGIAFLGTSGIVLALGVSSTTPAHANGFFDCVNDGTADDNTAEPGDNPTEDRDNILEVLDDHNEICLNGDFRLTGTIEYNADIHVYGIGNSSIDAMQSASVFYSDYVGGSDIVINNLSISNSTGDAAVVGNSVIILESTFEGNSYGAVQGTSVTAVSSTFVNNSADDDGYLDGGAIWSAEHTDAENCTFDGNTAKNGGAIYANDVTIVNSTFLDNEASDEGGAIYSFSGEVFLSTFVNNTASVPSADLEADTPGNAIYKEGRYDPELFGYLEVGGNIFAGESIHPQLGYGAAPSHFIDLGGNVFSTPASVETDIAEVPWVDPSAKHESTFFEATLLSLFGTSSPSLGNYEPNSSGTQTIALASGSPALDRVLESTFLSDPPTFDQRGAARSYPADAGAFEGYVTRGLADTGTSSPWWVALYSSALIAIGSLAVAFAKRKRSRTS